MLRVVFEFVSKSKYLKRLEFESIHMSTVMIAALGQSLSDHQQGISFPPSRNISECFSGLKFLSLRNISLGDEGLRILSPHLSQCRIQCLTLQKCQLTDGSLPFLSNILKARDKLC